jgi:ACS family tartrate transporter-like MFS transporter
MAMQNLSIENESASRQRRRNRLMAKISWRLLPLMMVLYVVSYLDRINLSFVALQMNSELQFRSEVYGLGSGIFFLGYCAFGIPSNLIIGRLGPRQMTPVLPGANVSFVSALILLAATSTMTAVLALICRPKVHIT